MKAWLDELYERLRISLLFLIRLRITKLRTLDTLSYNIVLPKLTNHESQVYYHSFVLPRYHVFQFNRLSRERSFFRGEEESKSSDERASPQEEGRD